MKWHIGCSGFHYRDWKEVFYPTGLPQRRWFEFYSAQFDTLEINSTFYRFPQMKTLLNWYETSPSPYYFSVKVPRLITHYKRLNECHSLLDDFYGSIGSGLKEKLGPVLFQFPPSFAYSPERMEAINQHLRSGYKNVVEFRHLSWWDPSVLLELRSRNISVSGISHPTLPEDALLTTGMAYYRFHGRPKLYYSAYEPADLRSVVSQLESNDQLQEAFIYFNNTATMGAIENAKWLKEFLQTKKGQFSTSP